MTIFADLSQCQTDQPLFEIHQDRIRTVPSKSIIDLGCISASPHSSTVRDWHFGFCARHCSSARSPAANSPTHFPRPYGPFVYIGSLFCSSSISGQKYTFTHVPYTHLPLRRFHGTICAFISVCVDGCCCDRNGFPVNIPSGLFLMSLRKQWCPLSSV